MTHKPSKSIAIAQPDSLPKSLIEVMTISLLFALSLALLSSCSQTASKTEADSDTSSSAKSEFVEETATKSNFDAVAYSGPTFTLATPEGSTMTFTDMLGHGKPVILNFWGTWCPPCRREMPEFVKIYEEYEGLQLVGVALRDTPQKLNAYTGQNGIKWPMVLGDVKTAKDYGGISGVPTTIFYDSQGLELDRYVGPMSYQMFKAKIEAALRHETEIASL